MQGVVEPLRNELLMPEHLTVRHGRIEPVDTYTMLVRPAVDRLEQSMAVAS